MGALRVMGDDPFTREELLTAKEYGLTMSQWDALSKDDKEWCLSSRVPPATCPICGGENPDETCQNPSLSHAWHVQWEDCFKTRAIIEASDARKKAKDKYLQAKSPRVGVIGSLLEEDQIEKLKEMKVEVI